MPMGSEVFGVGRPVAAILQLRRIRKCPGGGVRGRRPRGRAEGPAGGHQAANGAAPYASLSG